RVEIGDPPDSENVDDPRTERDERESGGDHQLPLGIEQISLAPGAGLGIRRGHGELLMESRTVPRGSTGEDAEDPSSVQRVSLHDASLGIAARDSPNQWDFLRELARETTRDREDSNKSSQRWPRPCAPASLDFSFSTSAAPERELRVEFLI